MIHCGLLEEDDLTSWFLACPLRVDSAPFYSFHLNTKTLFHSVSYFLGQDHVHMYNAMLPPFPAYLSKHLIAFQSHYILGQPFLFISNVPCTY